MNEVASETGEMTGAIVEVSKVEMNYQERAEVIEIGDSDEKFMKVEDEDEEAMKFEMDDEEAPEIEHMS
jgi:DNA replicative helicase MCM subunit Mcm2 (Cdc46/Mcm family)